LLQIFFLDSKMTDHHERREYNYEMVRTLARIEEKVDSLAGEHGRVTALEKQANRHWWFTVAIAPALALAHGVCRKLGLDI
jgi:hypothetical protein